MELSQRLNLDTPAAAQPAGDVERIAQIIEEVTGVDAATITTETTRASAGIDSLSVIEIIVRVEEAFGVRIDDSTAADFHDVGDIAAYVADNR